MTEFDRLRNIPAKMPVLQDGSRKLQLDSYELNIQMDDFRRRKAVEPRGRGAAISTNIFRIDEVFDFQFRKLLGQ